MVVGGGILKVPQIAKIISTRSTRGLSLSAFVSQPEFLSTHTSSMTDAIICYPAGLQVMETFAYGITTAYSARNLFPFSQYGENAFLAASNIIILALFFLYGPGGTLQPNVKGLLAVLVGSIGLSVWVASETLCPPAIRKYRDKVDPTLCLI